MQSKVAPALDIDVGQLKTIEGREKSVEMGERKGGVMRWQAFNGQFLNFLNLHLSINIFKITF